MKQFLFSLAILLAANVSLSAQSDSLLTVKVTGIKNNKGHILIALYNKAEDWNKPEIAKYVRKEPASEGAMLIEFAHLAPGDYAAAVVHDEDDTGGMSYARYGMPIEDYGFSNGARALFGAPAYEKCVFTFDRSGMITLEVTR